MKTILILAVLLFLPWLSNDASAGTRPDSSLSAAIAESRLAARPVDDADGEWRMRNPRHGLSARFTSDGLVMRVEKAGTGKKILSTRWTTTGLGYGESLAPVSEGVVAADENRIEIRRPGLVEWFVNTEEGLEHGYTLSSPPAGERGEAPLRVAMELEGDLSVEVADGHLVLRDADGSEALRYDKLKVWDATGRGLVARMAGESRRLAIEVEDAGAVYPVTIDPVFSQAAYLKASNSGEDDRFGHSVAIDGDTAVVGAPAEEGASPGVNGPDNDDLDEAGAAYVFVRNGGVWTEQAYLKSIAPSEDALFGYSVAIDGDTVAVGAIGNAGNPALGNAGAAEVFVRSNGAWTHEATLRASNRGLEDLFGYSIAVAGDTVLVGAPEEDGSNTFINVPSDNAEADSGAAYVFTRSAGVWSQQAYLKAANGESEDALGWSVDLSGDTAIVGAPGEDGGSRTINGIDSNLLAESGAAYVFVRTNGVWSQQAYLKSFNADAFDGFGFSAAIDGDRAIVGATSESGSSSGANGPDNNDLVVSGAAYVFLRQSGVWSQEAYLKASNPGPGDQFGTSVDLAGETAIVGAPYEDGDSTFVNGPANDLLGEAGAAYVFGRFGGAWAQSAYLKPSNPGLEDYFGFAVAITETTALVGAYGEAGTSNTVNGPVDDLDKDTGAAYVFDLPSVEEPPPPPPATPGYLSVVQPRPFPTTRIFRRSRPQILSITNAGGTPVTGISLSLRGRQAPEFYLTGPEKTTLAPGETATVSIVFKPWSRARYQVFGTVRSSAAPVGFSLQGRGR